MSNFAIEKIEAINGKQKFDQLVINGEKQLDAFERDIANDTSYMSEFITILAYMDMDANGLNIGNKRKELKGAKGVKEFEYRTKHLRIYAIQQFNGKIVIVGGYKKDQKKDISRFRFLKKQYLQSL